MPSRRQNENIKKLEISIQILNAIVVEIVRVLLTHYRGSPRQPAVSRRRSVTVVSRAVHFNFLVVYNTCVYTATSYTDSGEQLAKKVRNWNFQTSKKLTYSKI